MNITAQSIASNFTGSGQFLKTGAGELTLTSSSSYTGPTTISGGALIVNGALNGGGPVTVQNGATIGGTGTVIGNVTIQSGGTDAPGDGIGTGTFGSSTWQAGGNIQIEINNANGVAGGPSGWDLRQIDGTLDISDLVNGNFNVQLIGDADGFDAREDYLWQFVSYNSLATGALDLQSLADSFNVDTSLFTGDMQGGQFRVVDTGSGLALSFAAVPEPATIGLWLVLGASLACGIARRVRRTK